MALPTRLGKEVSVGTSTAAMIDALSHGGGHPVVYIIIVAGFAVAAVFHIVESKLEEKNENHKARKSGVRDYGIIRVF